MSDLQVKDQQKKRNSLPKKKAVLIGVFDSADKESVKFTQSGDQLNSSTGGVIEKQIKILGPIKRCKVRVFYDVSPDYPVVAVVGLGSENAGYNELEEIDEKNENIRAAVSAGVRTLRELGSIDQVDVDCCENPLVASEGANLGLYYFDELKCQAYKKPVVTVNMLKLNDNKSTGNTEDQQKTENLWNEGVLLSQGQNFCRSLMENPANIMTPTNFAKIVEEKLTKVGVTVTIHDKAWAEGMKMFSFLSVSKGSEEPPVFLEMRYNNGGDAKPIVFVGKGITFDSGGISLKQSSNMDKMRADMGGAANVVSTILTLAAKKAPVNIVGLTPLCENLPSGKANKPGDVVTAMNGKTIQIDNTDAEGRLILADALCYAHQFDPLLIMDIATLTGAMNVALGSACTGVYSTSAKYFELLHQCGSVTGDRVWRMPLFNHFTKQTTDGMLADLNNIGKYMGQGGANIAAAFLREFVTTPNWMHLDMAGVVDVKDEVPYLCKGMSGRPMRTLVKFIEEVFEKKAF